MIMIDSDVYITFRYDLFIEIIYPTISRDGHLKILPSSKLILLATANCQRGTLLFFLADAPARYCAWNKLVSQDSQVVGTKCVMLTFCLF